MNYSNSNLNTLGYGDGKVSMDDTIGCDGEVIHYEAATNGIQNIGNRNEDFFSAEGEPEDDYYNAKGGGLFGNFRKNQKMRQQRRNERNKAKNQARLMRGKANIGRSEAKKGLAKAQQLSAKASEKAVAGDIALANAMASNTPQAETQGMSKGLKIGLIVGAVVVVGIVGFVVYNKFIKKK
jgi:cobalamin biosynthesis Mg chelatase CobN